MPGSRPRRRCITVVLDRVYAHVRDTFVPVLHKPGSLSQAIDGRFNVGWSLGLLWVGHFVPGMIRSMSISHQYWQSLAMSSGIVRSLERDTAPSMLEKSMQSTERTVPEGTYKP
jgi:hypothetical protein